MQNAIDQLLFLIGLSNVVLIFLYAFMTAGLIYTRLKTGNTVTLGMILERLALFCFFLWNLWLTIAYSSSFYDIYTPNIRFVTLFARFAIAILFMIASWVMIKGNRK